MKNHWSREDDEKVALHYLRHGDAEHAAIIAALPDHKPASVRMRVGNFRALDTGDAHGLSHTSEQERDVWRFAAAVRDVVRGGTP